MILRRCDRSQGLSLSLDIQAFLISYLYMTVYTILHMTGEQFYEVDQETNLLGCTSGFAQED
jgi:hypothetical protein